MGKKLVAWLLFVFKELNYLDASKWFLIFPMSTFLVVVLVLEFVYACFLLLEFLGHIIQLTVD